jgi:SAM-dependent methyltransferase
VQSNLYLIEQASARNRGAILSGRLSLRLGNFETLPFAEGSIDGVLAVNVAYFWTRGELIASEVRRALRPRGKLALYVTDRGTTQHWGFANHGTHRHWDALALSAMLCAGGSPPPIDRHPKGSAARRDPRLVGGCSGDVNWWD